MDNIGWHMFGGILPLIFWVVTIAILLSVFRRGFRYGGWSDSDRSDRAIDILKERYAKGEINKAEFEEKRKDLEK